MTKAAHYLRATMHANTPPRCPQCRIPAAKVSIIPIATLVADGSFDVADFNTWQCGMCGGLTIDGGQTWHEPNMRHDVRHHPSWTWQSRLRFGARDARRFMGDKLVSLQITTNGGKPQKVVVRGWHTVLAGIGSAVAIALWAREVTRD